MPVLGFQGLDKNPPSMYAARDCRSNEFVIYLQETFSDSAFPDTQSSKTGKTATSEADARVERILSSEWPVQWQVSGLPSLVHNLSCGRGTGRYTRAATPCSVVALVF